VNQSTIELKEAVFWLDDSRRLNGFKLPRLKWLHQDLQYGRLDAYVRASAFQPMSDIIFVNFIYVDSDDDYDLVVELLHDLPSVTLMSVCDSQRLLAIQ
jgi:hypothetical protein